MLKPTLLLRNLVSISQEHNMDLYSQITAVYPELTIEDFYPELKTIILKDDG